MDVIDKPCTQTIQNTVQKCNSDVLVLVVFIVSCLTNSFCECTIVFAQSSARSEGVLCGIWGLNDCLHIVPQEVPVEFWIFAHFALRLAPHSSLFQIGQAPT